tara:strand:+ start:351 stop:548 length:198 start_codon:yes stop_codon:yes gene_type:complete
MVNINLNSKEVELLVSISKKIIIALDERDEDKREKNKDYALDNMTNDANHDKVLRRSEDQGDSYG